MLVGEWIAKSTQTKQKKSITHSSRDYINPLSLHSLTGRELLSPGEEAAATLDEATADGIKLRLKRRWIRGQPAHCSEFKILNHKGTE